MKILETIQALSRTFRSIETGEFAPSYSHHLHSRNGKLLGISGGSLCYPITNSDNYRTLIEWILQTEDKRFYEHGALDYKGILRALSENIKFRRIKQGGSTISQQLARTLFLDSSRTWSRKIIEALIAFKLEKQLTKDEILKHYCDFVYMGRGTRGFEAASRVIYRKRFNSLNKSEIASLIGLLGGPNRFHPSRSEASFWNRAETKARHLGEHIEAKHTNPVQLLRAGKRSFENASLHELSRLKIPHRDVKFIETSIDENMQNAIDYELKKFSKESGISCIAATIICNKTGDILCESTWKKGNPTEFSPSFSGKIQPGSTFKTFCLLAALEKGISPQTTLESSPYISQTRNRKTWMVRNYGDKYLKELSLENALVHSDNTVFARLSELIGEEYLASIYSKYSLVKEEVFSRAAILGGLRDGVSLLSIANAYATIARNGVAIEPRLIRFVEHQDGTVTFIKPDRGVTISSFSSILELKRILAVSGIKSKSVTFSGKSGTTKKGSLFAGYNEDISLALWLDFEHEQPELEPKSITATTIAKSLINKALHWTEKRTFSII